MTAAVTFAAYLGALLTAHNVADHWVQTHHQALTKGARSREGARACLAHVATYTAITAAFGALVWVLLDLPITPAGFVAGQLVSAVTHYWADRRWTLAGLARLIGKSEYYTLGAPRPGHDDNPTIGTGAYSLDQSWHHLWLFAAALLTALI
ncbi:transcriptional regulator [Kribbella sp. NPDC059898]|uniref:transcriptional regulator n=1 Tax=Kribbella sp. NPDC059898 TaxID=3346995 RepID=UPI003660C6E8